MQPTQPVPHDFLALIAKTAPEDAVIVPLAWAYEDETYNIAVVVLDIVTDDDVRQIEDRLIDAVMDWDEAHGTYTHTMVWREREKANAGIR